MSHLPLTSISSAPTFQHVTCWPTAGDISLAAWSKGVRGASLSAGHIHNSNKANYWKKKICSIAAEEIKIGQVDYNLSQLQANEIPSTGHEGPQTSLRQVLRPFNWTLNFDHLLVSFRWVPISQRQAHFHLTGWENWTADKGTWGRRLVRQMQWVGAGRVVLDAVHRCSRCCLEFNFSCPLHFTKLCKFSALEEPVPWLSAEVWKPRVSEQLSWTPSGTI